MNEIIQFFTDNYIFIIGFITFLVIVVDFFIDDVISIGKWSYSLMEWFFGIAIIFSVCYSLFLILTSCHLSFQEYSDGWYLVMDHGGVDATGLSYENLEKVDGPFTKNEVDEMLKECKSIYQEYLE